MAEPANRRDNPAGGKYYINPANPKERWDSVTTILDTVDKAALKIWAGQVAAQHALDSIPELVAATLLDECGQSSSKDNRCGRCMPCLYKRIANQHYYESKRRAGEGTEIHEAIKLWLMGHTGIRVTVQGQPYWEQFQAFVRDYGLRRDMSAVPGSWFMTEATVVNRTHGYAGTLDAGIVFDRSTPASAEICDRLGLHAARVLTDYKTREKPDERLYNDLPLQLSAYRYGELVMLPDGSETPIPEFDGAAILQLRPGSYTFRLADVGPETFQAFLYTAGVYRWLQGPAKQAMALERFPRQAGIAAQAVIAPVDVDPFMDSQPVDTVTDELGDDPWGDDFQVTQVVEMPPWEELDRAVETVTAVFPGATVVERDPFEAHSSPAQRAADAGRPVLAVAPARTAPPPSAPPPAKAAAKKTTRKAAAKSAEKQTIAEILRITPGKPTQSLYDDDIPF